MALLTPKLARAYAQKTPKTLTRDLNAIRKLELVQRTRGGYIANKDIIRSFQPNGIDGVLERDTMSLVDRDDPRTVTAIIEPEQGRV